MAKSKSKYELDNFLKVHKRKQNEDYTHTALPNLPESFAGSYTISKNDYSKFLDLYYESIFKNGNDAYLTEKHLNFSSILIDLDFRFPPNIKNRQYNNTFIESFLKIYLNLVNEIITIENNIEIFILEKKVPKYDKEKNLVKDGIHIMIPNIITFPKIQYILRYRLLQNSQLKELFNNLGSTNEHTDIVDMCVIEKNNWQFYGSMKPNSEPYLVTKIYKYDNKNVTILDKKYNNKELLKFLSIRNINEDDINTINENAYEKIDHDFDNMPVNYKMKRKTKLKSANRSSKRRKKKSPNKLDNSNETKQLEKIGKFISILNPKRADNYDNWIKLGWCLHNIDDRLLLSWINFSKQSSKFEEGSCEYEWERMDNNGLGLGTLYMWAKEDNYGKYKELTANDLRKLLLKSLTSAHNDIARVLYELFKDEFVYGKSKCWYIFRNHRWVRIGDGIYLKKKISNELVNEYLRFNIETGSKAQDLDDDDPEKEILMERMKKISSISLKLKGNSFKKNILDEATEFFYKEDFEELLDTNTHLIGFENGVYDLNSELFRQGIPEDYISLSTKINYEQYDCYDELIQEVNTFIQQVLPKKDVREYVLTLLSSFLDGKITLEKFHIWTGCGGNGKSKLIELFQNCYGDYCTIFPCSLITQKRARAESCNPSLANSKGKRFVAFQEPDANDKINVGLMKELTGGIKSKREVFTKNQLNLSHNLR